MLVYDGRADQALRAQLRQRGLDVARGVVLLEGAQARRLYPLLLLTRRMALQWKGLPEDPDQTGLRQA